MNEFLKRTMELNNSILADRLTVMSIEAKELCQSGMIGLIKGKKPGKVYLLRADMDAQCAFNWLKNHSDK